MSTLNALSGREALRWGAAALVVAGLHAGGIWYAQPGPPEALALAGDPTVQMIDLAPAMVENEPIGAEAAPAVETADTVTEMTTAEKVVTEDEPVEEPIVETQAAEAVQLEEEAQPVEELAAEEEVAETEVVVPKKVEKPKPVAKPVEKPKPDPKKIAEEKERREKQREERRKAAAEKAEKQKQAADRAAAKAASADNGRGTAEKKTAAGVQGARNGAAKRGGEGGGASVSSWIGKVNARLLRLQSRARVRDSGQAGVRFAFNDSGSITSVTVVRSSGNPKVDDAAVALIRKASPIPAPPDGAPRSHTITIQFR